MCIQSNQNLETAIRKFEETFGGRPVAMGCAPGRVEILGNHTDYNEGFILSAAIDRHCVVVGRRIDEQEIRVASEMFTAPVIVDPRNLTQVSGDGAWVNYVLGVVKELECCGGFEAYVSSAVPAGAGVSSSAALELATAHLLKELFKLELTDLQMIMACKAAENNFVGMGCGVLDQFSSAMGKAGQAIFLDCRDLAGYELKPLDSSKASFVLAHTHAPHQLVDGKYNELRRCCFAGAESLNKQLPQEVTHLRDVSVDEFEQHKNELPTGVVERVKHVVYENQRVLRGVAAMTRGDLADLGKAMSESHQSSRFDFGNSCKELDLMYDAAVGLDGWFGGRLMGGGFGGCTINLVASENIKSFEEALGAKYKEATGITPSFIVVNAGDGAFGKVL